MAWRYRIREVRLTTGETLYYPQFRHEWFPFWCHFRDYPDEQKVSFTFYSEALEFVNESKSKDEPEVKQVVRNHYL